MKLSNGIRIIAINPGSTSTKIAVYENETPVLIKNITHTPEELAPFNKITDQFEFRKNIICKILKDAEIRLDLVQAVVGRGGLVKPIESGVYLVNERMKEDLINSPFGAEHASNLGGLIADNLAKLMPNAKAYIANPVVVDEFENIARYSGHPLLPRTSIFHALNQKTVARQHARSIMKKYEDINLIVVHLGGGITVGAHKKGRVVDVNQGLDGDGPFSPERTGSLPVGPLIKLCFGGKYTESEILKMNKGAGGLMAYFGTNSAYEIEQRAQKGDIEAKNVFAAMAYQVSKEIGAMYAVLSGDADGILITGGVAHSKWFVNEISQRVHKMAPVHIYPGEDEMRALAFNGLRVIRGETIAKEYV
ncbi:MAG: butyrate kinase [Bacteroidales bacterium]|jgi:butyrate kinase|nr:butyrate kinase [Bacteroidales bacterium]